MLIEILNYGDEWLSFNGRQSGHNQRYNSNMQIIDDFRRSPAKPIIELEPLYEDHPLEFNPDNEGHSCSWDVRRTLYWSVFCGSAGVTYGHHSVWQMYNPAKGEALDWVLVIDDARKRYPAPGKTLKKQ